MLEITLSPRGFMKTNGYAQTVQTWSLVAALRTRGCDEIARHHLPRYWLWVKLHQWRGPAPGLVRGT